MEEPTELKFFFFKDKTSKSSIKTHCSNKHWVTECGMVYSESVDRFLTAHLESGGYWRICINDIKYYVHVLVAKVYCFNPDPDTKIEVDHIDGNRKNAHYKNLRWVSHSENISNAHKSGALKPAYKKVNQCDDKGDVIKKFNSIKDAALTINPTKSKSKTARTNILRSVLTKSKYLGFYWRFDSDKTEWTPPRRPNSKSILQINDETDEIVNTFNSFSEAVKYLELSNVTITKYIKNKIVKDGFRYEYAPLVSKTFDLSFLKEKVEVDGKMVKIWKPIKDNEKYYVSREGKVFSTKQNKFLRLNVNDKGYVSVQVTKKEGKGTINLNVARLVMKTHGPPNVENKPTVDHIDSNPSNNNISNLVWATGKEQNNRIMGKETHPNFVAVGYYQDGELIKRYKNIAEAARDNNVSYSTISKRLKKGTDWKRL
jgi:hypothetical protein